jgi:general stress protein 26
MTDRTDTTEAEIRLWDLIRHMDYAMLTTIDEDGSLRSRPMVPRELGAKETEFDGTLWFFTRAEGPKSEEVERHDRVNLSYADPDEQTYVSVSGSAELVRDRGKAESLWNDAMVTWFPKGLDDPDLALLKVTVEKAEYWDAALSRMVHTDGATSTNTAPSPGDHARGTMR